jgi:hypothetical protein
MLVSGVSLWHLHMLTLATMSRNLYSREIVLESTSAFRSHFDRTCGQRIRHLLHQVHCVDVLDHAQRAH